MTTALDLFASKGYEATAVREICDAAGITKPTLYHFYGSKEGVLQALVSAGFARYRNIVDTALNHDGTFRERLKLVARALFDSAKREPQFWRFMHSVLWAPSRAPGHLDACGAFYDSVVAALSAAADHAVDRGELSPGPHMTRVLVLMGALSEATTGYVISGRPDLTPRLADELIDTIVDGWLPQVP